MHLFSCNVFFYVPFLLLAIILVIAIIIRCVLER